MSNPVKLMAIITAKPDKTDELKALLFGMVTASRAEKGNLRYDLWQDQTDPARFVLDELYTDDAAVASHRATAHFQNYLAKVGDLAARTVFALDPLQIA